MGHGMIPTSLVPSPPPQLSSFTVLRVMMAVECGLGTRLATLPTGTTSMFAFWCGEPGNEASYPPHLRNFNGVGSLGNLSCISSLEGVGCSQYVARASPGLLKIVQYVRRAGKEPAWEQSQVCERAARLELAYCTKM